MANIRQNIKDFLRRKYGIDVNRYPLYRMLRDLDIDLVLDIGANRGQYAKDIYRAGYTGKCISLEPIPYVCKVLEMESKNYKDWEIRNFALGSNSGIQKMYVTKQDASSSFYHVNEKYKNLYDDILSQSMEINVSVKTIDEIYQEYDLGRHRTFLKLDVQGAEMDVLEGGEKSLGMIHGIQVETSLSSVYDGPPLIEDVIKKLRGAGFKPVFIRPGFKNPDSWEYHDADILFVNEN